MQQNRGRIMLEKLIFVKQNIADVISAEYSLKSLSVQVFLRVNFRQTSSFYVFLGKCWNLKNDLFPVLTYRRPIL